MVQKYTRIKIGQFTLPYNPESVDVKLSKKIVRIQIPGRDGDVIQLLGMNTKEINFKGVFVKDADRNTISLLKEFEKKAPLDLVFPIRVNQLSNPTKVIIDTIQIGSGAGDYDMNTYSIAVLEWRPVEIKKNMVNLINIGPKTDMVNKLRQQRVI